MLFREPEHGAIVVKFLITLLFTFCGLRLRPAPLPAHAGDEMGHGEPEEHEAEESGDGGADRHDPEGGQEREGLGSEAFAGGGDEGGDGIPFGK